MRSYLLKDFTERERLTPQFYLVLITFICSLCFLLFQGGKLASVLFTIVSILTVYLILGNWSGIKRTQGIRELALADKEMTLDAGNSLTVRINLQIPGYWPIPYVLVKDRLVRRNGKEQVFEASLVPDWRRKGELEYSTPPLRRGYYHFGATDCSTEDVFGLFEHKGSIEMPHALAVLPQTIGIKEWRQLHQLVNGTSHHSATTRALRETTQLNGVREYIYGDRLSRIHWNATAKTGTWKSKEFERESLPKTMILMDRAETSYKDPELFELAVSVTASLFQYSVNRELALGLLSVGSDNAYFEPKKGGAHQKSVMNHLIGVEADGWHNLLGVLKDRGPLLVPGTFIAVISPLSGERMMQTLNWIKQRQMTPCHIWISQGDKHDEHWLSLLASRGMTGYAVRSLQELPLVLGGRNQ